MDKEFILKHTTSFKDNLLEDLKDPEFAQYYLEAALEDYEKDGDTESLLVAMRDVAQARGGIGKLAKQTGLNRSHLYEVLDGKHNPRLDNLLTILSGLGFRIRLERQEDNTDEQTPTIEEQPVAGIEIHQEGLHRNVGD